MKIVIILVSLISIQACTEKEPEGLKVGSCITNITNSLALIDGHFTGSRYQIESVKGDTIKLRYYTYQYGQEHTHIKTSQMGRDFVKASCPEDLLTLRGK